MAPNIGRPDPQKGSGPGAINSPEPPFFVPLQDSSDSPANKAACLIEPLTVSNPRQRRALVALLRFPVTREALDSVAGCSNSPQLVADLRAKGLELPCFRIVRIDRDGRTCRPGLYALTNADKQAVRLAIEQIGV